MKAADGDLLCIVTGRWWRNIRRWDGRSKRTTIPTPFSGGNDVIPMSFPVTRCRWNTVNNCISLTFEVCCTSELNSPVNSFFLNARIYVSWDFIEKV